MGMDKFSLGKMLAERLGITRDTRPGRIMWPMNAQAKAEQERHSAVLNPLVRQLATLQVKVKLIEATIEAEQVEWRGNMIDAHPEMADYSFSIDDKKWVMRVDYHEGETLLPGDSYADEEGEGPTPPAWVDEVMQTVQ